MKLFKIICMPFIILRDTAQFFITHMPGATGIILRRLYYRKAFKRCGKNLVVDVGVSISGAKFISVGDNVFIDKYCVIATGDKLTGKITRKSNKDFNFSEGEIVLGNDIHLAQF